MLRLHGQYVGCASGLQKYIAASEIISLANCKGQHVAVYVHITLASARCEVVERGNPSILHALFNSFSKEKNPPAPYPPAEKTPNPQALPFPIFSKTQYQPITRRAPVSNPPSNLTSSSDRHSSAPSSALSLPSPVSGTALPLRQSGHRHTTSPRPGPLGTRLRSCCRCRACCARSAAGVGRGSGRDISVRLRRVGRRKRRRGVVV